MAKVLLNTKYFQGQLGRGYAGSMLKGFLIVVGSLSLALGAIGIFLPILPTTPFMLLAAYCFGRSSQRLHNYLVTHKTFGTYISNYYNHAMTPAHKARTLVALWFSIILTILLIGSLIPAIILPIIAGMVSLHILRLHPKQAPQPVLIDAPPTPVEPQARQTEQ